MEKRRYVGETPVRIEGVGEITPGATVWVEPKVAYDLRDLLKPFPPKPNKEKSIEPKQIKGGDKVNGRI